MYITFANIAGDLQYILPVIPEKVSIKTGAENETIDTLSGMIRLSGSKNLKEISWDCFFPVNKNYPFQEFGSDLDGWNYVNFFNQILDLEIPMRMIITTDKKPNNTKRTIFNQLVSVDSFEYSTDKVGDINYTLSLTEFPSDRWDMLNTALKLTNTILENSGNSAKKRLEEYGLI